MELKSSVFFAILIIQCVSVFCAGGDFDFYYFVQQWPPSFCNTRRGCCYPTTGKPAEDFGIYGFRPGRYDGSWQQFCDQKSSFNQSQVSDLIPRMQKDWPLLACPSSDGINFWSNEWRMHGTCTTLSQYDYFQTTLDLKEKVNILKVLKDSGIQPNGEFYSLEAIKDLIKKGLGYAAIIQCNVDKAKNQQLQEVYLCVNKTASEFIDCPPLHDGK